LREFLACVETVWNRWKMSHGETLEKAREHVPWRRRKITLREHSSYMKGSDGQ